MVCIKSYMLEIKRNESGAKGDYYSWKLTTSAKATPLEKWLLFRKVMPSNSETTYKSDGILTIPTRAQFPPNQLQPESIPTQITIVHKKFCFNFIGIKIFGVHKRDFYIYLYKNIFCAQKVSFVLVCIKIVYVHKKLVSYLYV